MQRAIEGRIHNWLALRNRQRNRRAPLARANIAFAGLDFKAARQFADRHEQQFVVFVR